LQIHQKPQEELPFKYIIIDEAHERNLNSDLLLGILKQRMVGSKDDFKLIITSATMDPTLFSDFFRSICKAEVIKVSGRTFPVEIHWADDGSEDAEVELDRSLKQLANSEMGKVSLTVPSEQDVSEAMVKKVMEVLRAELKGLKAEAILDDIEEEGEGGADGQKSHDILGFMSGPDVIEKCASQLEQTLKKEKMLEKVQILPLHGRLEAYQQRRVFEPAPRGKKKVVLSTRIAETSVTINGIGHVIDSGLTRESRFDPIKNMSVIEVKFVTQSSANQRTGRAGRTAPGICHRLYSKAQFAAMAPLEIPEIRRSNLAQSALKLTSLGVDPLSFEFVQPPEPEAMQKALNLLGHLEVVDEKNGIKYINAAGKFMLQLPTEPQASKALMVADELGCLEQVAIIIGMLPYTMGLFFKAKQDEYKKRELDRLKFSKGGGDHLMLLTVYTEWKKIKSTDRRQWCRQHNLAMKALSLGHENINEITKAYQNAKGNVNRRGWFNEFARVRQPFKEEEPIEVPKEEIEEDNEVKEENKEEDEKEETQEAEEAEEKEENLLLEIEEGQVVEEKEDKDKGPNTKENISRKIREALTRGFFSNTCVSEGTKLDTYLTVSQRTSATVHGSSILITESGKNKAKFVIYHELFKTTKTFLRTITPCDVDWLPQSYRTEQGVAALAAKVYDRYEDAFNKVCTSLLYQLDRISNDAFELGMENVVIQPAKGKGGLDVWCPQAIYQQMVHRLRNAITLKTLQLEQECIEVPLGTRGTRLLLRRGGEIMRIIRPNQFIRVAFENLKYPKNGTTHEVKRDLEEVLQGFGEILEVVGFVDPLQKIAWGQVCFFEPEYAKNVVDIFSGSDFRVKPIRGTSQTDKNSEEKSMSKMIDEARVIRIQWTPGSSKGWASVVFDSADSGRVLLNLVHPQINQRPIKITRSKNREAVLTFHKLTADVDEYDIIDFIEQYVEEESPRVYLQRDNHLNQRYEKETFITLFEPFGTIEKIEWRHEIREMRGWRQATITYQSGESVAKATSALNGKSNVIGMGKLRVFNAQSVQLQIDRKIFSLLKKKLQKVQKQEGSGTTVRNQFPTKDSRSYLMKMTISSVIPGKAQKLGNAFEKCILSYRVPILQSKSDTKEILFTAIGMRWITEMRNKFSQGFIYVDKESIELAFYGDPNDFKKVEGEAKHFIATRAQKREIVIEIPPRGLKALIGKDGLGFDRFQKKYAGLNKIHLDIRSRDITLYGENNAVSKAEAELVEIFKKVANPLEAANNPPKPAEICQICLCELEPGKYFRLSCLHGHCTTCLNLMLSTVQTIPITCPILECNKPVVLRDLSLLHGDTTQEFFKASLFKLSLTQFFQTNRGTHRQCPKRDCPGVLFITKETPLTRCPCDECEGVYCVQCYKGHAGSCKEASDEEFEQLKKLLKLMKCPGCKAPAEKEEGCNAMICSLCKVAFCFLCGKNCGKDAHPHFNERGPCFGKLFEGVYDHIQ